MEKIKALFYNQYAGIGLDMTCVAKSFQLPNKELRGVLLNDNLELTLYLSDKGYGDFYDINEWVINLRSVDQLTDDEAVIVAFQNRFIGNTDPDICAKVGRDILKRVFEDKQSNMCIPFECADYLRSIGVLLPFTYLDENNKPITLQPDEIIARGWAKISGEITLKEVGG
jgi:hypothetical protein